MKNRKQYTKEFKEGAVRLVAEQKRSMSDVAKSLDVTAWTISRRIKESKGEEAFRGNGNMASKVRYEIYGELSKPYTEARLNKPLPEVQVRSTIRPAPFCAITARMRCV